MKIHINKTLAAADFPNLRGLLEDAGCQVLDITQRARTLTVEMMAPRRAPLEFSADPNPKAFQMGMLQALKKDRYTCRYVGVKIRATGCTVVFNIVSN